MAQIWGNKDQEVWPASVRWKFAEFSAKFASLKVTRTGTTSSNIYPTRLPISRLSPLSYMWVKYYLSWCLLGVMNLATEVMLAQVRRCSFGPSANINTWTLDVNVYLMKQVNWADHKSKVVMDETWVLAQERDEERKEHTFQTLTYYVQSFQFAKLSFLYLATV